MKLHELVNLRNYLREINDASIVNLITKNIDLLSRASNDISSNYSEKISQTVSEYTKLIANLSSPQTLIQSVIDECQDEINRLSAKFFQSNYQFEISFKDDEFLPLNIRNYRSWRSLQDNGEFEENLKARINLYSNWRFPALEIGCRDGEWTKYLIANDPLYIADVHTEFLTNAVKDFPQIYQNRVRKYLIKDYKIENLPVNQFSLIFSYNFFNYLSLDTIKQFLIYSKDWLRPGGVMIFTYNNADNGAGAAYAESYFMTYVPKSMLIPLCESLGYTVVESRDYEPAMSWIEIKKPGELQTIKASQSIGEIVPVRY